MNNIFTPAFFSICPEPEAVFAEFQFRHEGRFRPDFPRCFLTLRAAGSMRFSWNQKNTRREDFFSSIHINSSCVVPLELVHSRIVYCIESAEQTFGKQGDGLITTNPRFVPSVTVADCMPIYLYEAKSGCFGVLHSGWKGTGIVAEALKLAEKNYGAKAENFSVILGPHIQACCYKVDEERGEYFSKEFTPDSVILRTNNQTQKTDRFLSLVAANMHLLQQIGIPTNNIAICGNCTSCSPFLGSFRRETAHLDESVPLEKRFEHFTPMAAFVLTGRLP